MEEDTQQESKNLWASGWRPFFGWVGGVGFLYTLLLQPLLSWYARIRGWPEPPPVDTGTLTVAITAIITIAGFRTYEKQKGVAS